MFIISKFITNGYAIFNSEVVLQFMIRSKEAQVLISMKVTYNQSSAEELFLEKNPFEFVFDAEKGGSKWSSSLQIASNLLTDPHFPRTKIDLKSFIVNAGFTSIQKKKLVKQFREALVIKNSRLLYEKQNAQSFFETKHLKKPVKFERYFARFSDKKLLATEVLAKFEALEKQQSKRKADQMPEEEDIIQVVNPSIRILTPDDPQYGNLQNIEHEFMKAKDIEWLFYYNEVRRANQKTYYFSIRHQSILYSIRLQFIPINSQEEVLVVGVYRTIDHLVSYTVIKDKRTHVIKYTANIN